MEKGAAFSPDQGKRMHTSLALLLPISLEVRGVTTRRKQVSSFLNRRGLGSFLYLYVFGFCVPLGLGPFLASSVDRVCDLPFETADLVGGIEVDAGHATASRDCTLKQDIEIQVLKECEAEFANMNQEVYSRNTQLPRGTCS